MIVSVTIPGEPVGQGRPRATTVGGFTRMYSPKRSAKWRKMAAGYMKAACRSPLLGPLEVTMTAVFTFPKSKVRKRTPSVNHVPCCKRPDIDNVVKAVLDAGNEVLWLDDAQVWKLEVTKVYGREGEEPSVILQVKGES